MPCSRLLRHCLSGCVLLTLLYAQLAIAGYACKMGQGVGDQEAC